jgi:hypothetical protein
VPLKYAAKLQLCRDQPCPCPKRHVPRRVDRAFRFMRSPATTKDFVPTGHDKDGANCGELALSFFDDLEAAQRKFAVLDERQDAALRYGDHIGEMQLEETDGVQSVPSKASRHINLHQDDQATLTFPGRVIGYSPARPK